MYDWIGSKDETPLYFELVHSTGEPISHHDAVKTSVTINLKEQVKSFRVHILKGLKLVISMDYILDIS